MLPLLVALSLAADSPPSPDAPALDEPSLDAPDLEARVAALEARVAELETALKAQKPPSLADESAASSLLMMVRGEMREGKAESARVLMKRLYADYPNTKAVQSAERVQLELDTIGTPLAEDWDTHVLDWLVKERRFDPRSGVTIALFWETWCPHCRKEMPKMNTLYAAHKEAGLKVVGFTKLSRTTTREEAVAFLEEHQIQFPIAQEDGELSASVSVRGIPAAAIFHDGVVVWRGHPALIDGTMLQTWLATPE